MKKYNPKNIEKKWQNKWDKSGIYRAKNFSKKPKYYSLIEFPYPSGAGLHVGHLRSHIAVDIISRKKRMSGFNVLYPIGWDAFGLPTENFAIKTKTHPAIVTKNNVKNFTRQIKSYGPSFDWSREINTTDPKYYKWTQWIFLKLFNSFYDEKLDKASPIEELDIPDGWDVFRTKEYIDSKRLAYEAEMNINWCPKCKIGLANEEVVNGVCERCGAPAEKRIKRQWMLRITKYAQRLINDLSDVDYLEKIKAQQINWIGRSEGAEVEFRIKNNESRIRVFTTRLDTIFGCTYVVLAPENPMIEALKLQIANYSEVSKYINDTKNKSDLDRTDLAKEKTGVEIKGIKAINPFSKEEVSIWVADYVLGSYGTGAVMAVPAHDERDFEFAKKYGLPIKQSIAQFFAGEGKDKKREETINVERNTVDVIIKHWSEEKFYCLDWSKYGWKSFVIGGIDKGEKKEDTAIREAKEETGYKNMRVVGNIGWEVHSEFFAAHKNENRYSKRNCVYIELSDGEYEDPDLEHIKNHKGSWVEKDKVQDFVNLQEAKLFWNIFLNGERSFTDEGILINSETYSNLTSAKAREEMTKWLMQNNLGKKTINYKLRDWVFSRQHYWGEPIPIIKCKHCGISDINFKMDLNFRDNNVWDQIAGGKKSIETRALNPEEKNRYFGDIKAGDVIKFNNKNTGDFEVVRIKKIYNFKDLNELLSSEDLLPKILPDSKIKTIKDIEKAYSFTKDYIENIKKNGLVGWEFEILDVTKNIPLRDADLPLELPNIKNYEPTDTGESPLANIRKWVNVKCPLCKNDVKRETDTMPNWAGSSWYFLRYLDPKNNREFVSQDKLEYWMPVDLYNGGMEHTTLHLLYSRFWHKFLFDLGYVNTSEPYKARRSHGMILAEDGQKMSKSRGNVINPDDVIKIYGADTLRLYEMFMGPYSEAIPWSTTSLIGMNRFLDRVWNLQFKVDARNKRSSQTNGYGTILVATNNQGKLKELKDHFKDFNIICISDLKTKYKEPIENGKTYEENSLIKAKYYARRTGYVTVADDSGFSVNALGGKPGVYSNRYAKGNYHKAQTQIIEGLTNESDRSAYFKCVITMYDPNNDTFKQFNGVCNGAVAKEPKGNGGFGYDPIFIPEGETATFGEMENIDKYKYDHRKKAVSKLIAFLEAENAIKTIDTLPTLHRTMKKVTEDIDNMKFNTAISQIMILSNEYEKKDSIPLEEFRSLMTILAPFSPHITEEIWQNLGNKKSIHLQSWPKFDESLVKEKEIQLVIQINGKIRDQIKVAVDISEDEAKKIALESEKIIKWIEGKEIKKVIFVKGRLVNIVI